MLYIFPLIICNTIPAQCVPESNAVKMYIKVVPEIEVDWIRYVDSKLDVYSSSTSSTLGAACACLLLTSPLPLFVAVTVAVVVFAASDPLDSSPFSPFLLFFAFFFFSCEQI